VSERLPLFPLETVLYPGLVLPLHIFEDRYRQLVQHLSAVPEGAPRRFGVVAIRQGREVGPGESLALHEIGCTAEIHTISPYDDGRYDIITTGATRFRLHSLDDSQAYLQGDVEFLDEGTGEDANVLAASVEQAFREYESSLLAARRQTTLEVPEMPEDPVLMSYLVAAAMILDTPDKQRLLAAADAAERLRAELALLRRETHILRQLPSLPVIGLPRQEVTLN
jgi:Lon protease-like protein